MVASRGAVETAAPLRYRHGYRPVERDGARRRADHGDWAALSGDAGWRRVDAARFRYVEIPDAPSDDDDDPTTVHCVVEGDDDAAGAAWVAKQKEKKKTKKKRDPDAPRSLLEWDAVFPASRALEFAFCYPYGVAEITATLDALENAYVRGADVPRTSRGDAAAATRLVRGDETPRPRRG